MKRTNIVPDEIGRVSLSKPKILWLYTMITPCFFIDFNTITVKIMLVGLILTILTVCLGHSIGLHRGVIHKSYKTSKLVRNVLLYLFTLTGLGGPLSWLKLHYYRDYWQNRKDCPKYFSYEHSLRKDFWWNLHLAFYPKSLNNYGIPQEDLEDNWLKWLEKTWYIHNLVLAFGIFIFFGLNTMLVLVFLRISITILAHWYIGYASHKYGYAHFEIEEAKESGFNDALLGFISFGEGFHNNHHAYPRSANFSSKWYEIDLGWYVILGLKKLNLIYQVKNFKEGKSSNKKVKKYKQLLLKFPL